MTGAVWEIVPSGRLRFLWLSTKITANIWLGKCTYKHLPPFFALSSVHNGGIKRVLCHLDL